MIELGQLEGRHQDFASRHVRVVAASLDGLEPSTKTQEMFPHLVIVSDEKESLVRAAGVIAPQRSPTGGDTAAPTTFFIDHGGTVRSLIRRDNFLARPAPEELLAGADGAFRHDR
jgi:peroxiredoxin